MEFPTIGGHCEALTCNTLSFLPYQCNFCQRTFCSEHRMPGDHACQQCFDASSVQLCPTCNQLVLSTGSVDPKQTLQEHLDSQCTRHLLPTVASTAVLCAKVGCRRQDRVVATCPDCDRTYCLGHRHGADHDCEGLTRKRDQQAQRKAEIRDLMAKHSDKFAQRKEPTSLQHQDDPSGTIQSSTVTTTTTTTTTTSGVIESRSQKASLAEGPTDAEKKQTRPSAKQVIEAAKARVAQRSASASTSLPGAATGLKAVPSKMAGAAIAATVPAAAAGTAAAGGGTAAAAGGTAAAAVATKAANTAGTAEKSKTKPPSRAKMLLELRKVAQGDAKVTGAQRIYVYTRSPVIQGVAGKSVFLDKTWTVGKSLDRITDILKLVPPKPDPNDPDKRLAIFHAKDDDAEPVLIAMPTIIKNIPGIENGDIFYIAHSNWSP